MRQKPFHRITIARTPRNKEQFQGRPSLWCAEKPPIHHKASHDRHSHKGKHNNPHHVSGVHNEKFLELNMRSGKCRRILYAVLGATDRTYPMPQLNVEYISSLEIPCLRMS